MLNGLTAMTAVNIDIFTAFLPLAKLASIRLKTIVMKPENDINFKNNSLYYHEML